MCILINKWKLQLVSMSLGLCCSCDSLVEVAAPDNLFDANRIFSSKTGIESVMSGIYQNMLVNNGLTNGGLSTYVSLASDDLVTGSTSVAYQGFLTNKILSDNSAINQFWQVAYRGIYRSNMVLEQLEKADFLTEHDYNSFRGQALFVRSFYYSYLSQLFGNVPLVLSTDYQVNMSLGRASVAEVREQVEQDLKIAVACLDKYPIKGLGIPNRFAAQSLLARICFLNRDYQDALELSDEIIEEGSFQLEADLDNVFKKDSREAIWQLTSETANVSDAISFVPSSETAVPVFTLSEELISSFEKGDLRSEKWVGRQLVRATEYYYPYKYKVRAGSQPLEYNVVFRLAETLLMRAEAKIQLKDYAGALLDLNAVRKRAGLGEVDFLNEEALMDALIKEKRAEFFAEWGHRWFDLNRWDIIDRYLQHVKRDWKTEAKLFPIPIAEINVNPNLVQNPGYDE